MGTEKALLIADGNPFTRDLLSVTLASAEYAILTASHGEQAWGLMLTHHPSVVLLDVALPGQGGLELARAIKRHPDLSQTRVLILSASDRDTEVEAGLQAGAEAYLAKPFSPLQLVGIVHDAMGVDAEGGPIRRRAG